MVTAIIVICVLAGALIWFVRPVRWRAQ